jgi:hypothetical protein
MALAIADGILQHGVEYRLQITGRAFSRPIAVAAPHAPLVIAQTEQIEAR